MAETETEVYGLRQQTATKVKQLTDALPPPRESGPLVSVRSALVKCFSDTAAGSGDIDGKCYPGIIQDHGANAKAPLGKMANVWLTIVDGDTFVAPSKDKTYFAILSGERKIGNELRTRAFATPAIAGTSTGGTCTPVVTSIQCDPNNVGFAKVGTVYAKLVTYTTETACKAAT